MNIKEKFKPGQKVAVYNDGLRIVGRVAQADDYGMIGVETDSGHGDGFYHHRQCRRILSKAQQIEEWVKEHLATSQFMFTKDVLLMEFCERFFPKLYEEIKAQRHNESQEIREVANFCNFARITKT